MRSFTPIGAEVFGAGHNALGAWWWLAEAGRLAFAGAATSATAIRSIGFRPDAKELFAVLDGVGGEGCYAFSLNPRQADAVAYARFFNPTVGIPEDPATGTAAGPLAAHLVAHGLAKPEQIIKVEQGTAMGRTSLIQVEVFANTVKVSGRGVVVASGRLTL